MLKYTGTELNIRHSLVDIHQSAMISIGLNVGLNIKGD